MRRKARKEKIEESCRKICSVWTKRLKLRMGGMYKVRGKAEKATANASCSIIAIVYNMIMGIYTSYDEYSTHGEDMHASNLRHSCCNSGEGSDEDMVESKDLACNSPTDMFSKIISSLAMSDAISFAPTILSC
ncbi:hypothetical protein D0Y65_007108 [Glycine soja]|uniref:Uncharacterized protein n=1 Tax=Glycine soja TaxID=3848 RepID=A0A445LBK4_GLYSO|nr:hypothetical protein D0Y65_007108 [Glycine soja]